MPVFILRVVVPSAPKKSTEIMIKGDTWEDVLKNSSIHVEKQQRVVEDATYQWNGETKHYKYIHYKRVPVQKWEYPKK